MVRILVIDDEVPVQRTLMRLLLEKAGYVLGVTKVGGGSEGIRAYLRQPADLVFCDLFMPGKDGLEVIRELRREYPNARIIAMSEGLDGKINLLPATMLIEATDHLHKPFTRDDLLAVVEKVLGA